MAAHSYSRHASARRGRPAPHAAPRGTVAALLGFGPVVGAILGKAVGAYDGTVFAVVCLASAAAAGVLAGPRGLWWVVPAPPPVIWAVGVGTELAWHDPPYHGANEQAVAVAHGTVHAFPVMAAVELALGVVVAARLSGARRRGTARG